MSMSNNDLQERQRRLRQVMGHGAPAPDDVTAPAHWPSLCPLEAERAGLQPGGGLLVRLVAVAASPKRPELIPVRARAAAHVVARTTVTLMAHQQRARRFTGTRRPPAAACEDVLPSGKPNVTLPSSPAPMTGNAIAAWTGSSPLVNSRNERADERDAMVTTMLSLERTS